MFTRSRCGWLFLGLALMLLGTPRAHAQPRNFHGLHVGVEYGSQSIIGGSRVDDLDVLAQESRSVMTLSAGVRYEFGMGLVVGAEATKGFLDGDLAHTEPEDELQIAYENDGQTTLGAIVGFAFGRQKDWLVFGYLSEATREFDVTIQSRGAEFDQRDEQGMLRYGVALERRLFRGLHAQMRVGSGRADFDHETNFDPDRRLEYAAGVLWQF